jgi:hypothetical protein
MSNVITRSKAKQLNLTENIQSNFSLNSPIQQKQKKRKLSNNPSFTLQSERPLKRSKTVEFGKSASYYTTLDENNAPINRGDDTRLMYPAKTLDDPYYWIRSDDRKDEDVLDLRNGCRESLGL